MRFTTVLAWGGGIWAAAGVEAARGGGVPGPLLLLGVAAGLWGGPTAGLIVGALAGWCSAALCGRDRWLLTLLSMGAGLLASAVPLWAARRNVLVGVLTALLCTLLVAGALTLLGGGSFSAAARFAAWRSGENGLWMIPIYGIVLLVSTPESSAEDTWDA